MPRILIADDELEVQQLLRYTLERSGYEIIVTSDGAETLARLQKEPVDLLILDVMLPHMDGHTLQLQLAQDPKTKNIPVIVLTAIDHVRSLFAKFPQVKKFVTKPFNPEELLGMVQEIAGAGRKK